MIVRKHVLEYIIALVVVKNKVRLKKCLKNMTKFYCPNKNWKKYKFLAVNRDFSHEILQKFSCLPPLGAIFFKSVPPNLKSWIRP